VVEVECTSTSRYVKLLLVQVGLVGAGGILHGATSSFFVVLASLFLIFKTYKFFFPTSCIDKQESFFSCHIVLLLDI